MDFLQAILALTALVLIVIAVVIIWGVIIGTLWQIGCDLFKRVKLKYFTNK